MSQALVAIKSARTYLNDYNGTTWSDHILMPLLQEAFGELIQELDVNSVGVIKYQTNPITVPVGALNLGANQPPNILEPIMMLERDAGGDAESFMNMYKVNFLPEEDQSQNLVWWAWLGETIQFIGATSVKEVILRYKGSLMTPQLLTDPIGVIYGERYLGPRVAALAKISINADAKSLLVLADKNLYSLVQRNVLSAQTPTRHRPYRQPKSVFGPTGPVTTVINSTPGGQTGVKWITPVSPADGIISTFLFLSIPKWISWNGVNQFQGVGYTIQAFAGGYNIQFIDGSGNILTPASGDDIQAEII